jgi:hypothetical protein
MGKLTTTSDDLARWVLAGTFSDTGRSAAIALYGRFNITLSGVGTVYLERSFDGGTNWYPVARDVSARRVDGGRHRRLARGGRMRRRRALPRQLHRLQLDHHLPREGRSGRL